jgi:hypothetical protein
VAELEVQVDSEHTQRAAAEDERRRLEAAHEALSRYES